MTCLHFHIGSQVSDIRATKEAVKEATRLYCHLKRRAPSLSVLDLGGGLGVDYDGTSSSSDWSLNYTLEGYCRDVVYGVKVVCDQERVDPPVLVTESGRAVLAYHAVTVVTPLKIIGRTPAAPPVVIGKDACYQVRELKSTLDELKPNNCRELVNDARALHVELITGLQARVRLARGPRGRRVALHRHLHQGAPDLGPERRVRRSSCARSRSSPRRASSATSRSSRACPTRGRSGRCSRCCRSRGSSTRP